MFEFLIITELKNLLFTEKNPAAEISFIVTVICWIKSRT